MANANLLTSGHKPYQNKDPKKFPGIERLAIHELALQDMIILRVGVQEPAPGTEIIGDILYLPGFADRLDNHAPLFDHWNSQGFRVVSFDYPSHGGTGGLPGLTWYGLPEFAGLAMEVEKATFEPGRPLVVAGWSTGGLLAIRMLQEKVFSLRQPAGAILIAPAVSPRLVVGNKFFVTQSTLSQNPQPPRMGKIWPKTPVLYPKFLASLVNNSFKAYEKPLGVPALVVKAGNHDRYVNSQSISNWIDEQNLRFAGAIRSMSCDDAYHELDNEPRGIGLQVRQVSAAAIQSYISGSRENFPDGPCSLD